MRRSIKFGALTAVLVLCTGCASTMQYRPLPDQGLRVEDPSKARIYVVRPTAFGGAIAMDVTDGDKRIGRTGPNG